MNTTEYIASDILERYVLGDVSVQESKEVECLSHIYPEIKTALTELQTTLEHYADAHAVPPPAALRDKIMAELDSLDAAKMPKPAPLLAPKTDTSSMLTRIFALIIVLLLGGIYYLYGSQEQLKNQVAEFTKNMQDAKQKSEDLTRQMLILKNPDYQKIALKGTPKSPDIQVILFWNATTKNVVILPNSLPLASADQQYQLWAIKDGQPIDAGVLPQQFAYSDLIAMKNIDNAQAFAITLEKKGGVASPTLTEMYVLGEV
jgi:anti-sigma-K factor RskA